MPMPPKNPQDLDKVNFIIDMWCRPCNAPWYIYLETMKPAALEAFIVLISFGWADVLRGALRPKGLGRRSSKRKGHWGRRVPRFPEVGNTLGKKLPFGEQVSEWITWGTKTKFLWRIDNAMQAGLFMWLVVDVAEDFLFNWTSLLYKSYWCRESHLGRFSYANAGLYARSGGVWWKMPYGVQDYEEAPPSWSFNHGTSGANGCKVFAAVHTKQHTTYDPPANASLRIYASLTGEVFAQTDSDDPADPNDIELVVGGDIPPFTAFRVGVFHDAPWAWVGDGAITAFETEYT